MSGATTLVVEPSLSTAFVNSVLDLKLKVDKAKRQPTRYEIRQLTAAAPPNTITEEIAQMFNRFSKGLDYE